MQSLIDFLQIELDDRTRTLQEELFPQTQSLINGALSLTHEKLQHLSNRIKALE
jgi:hypothetical protein